MPYDMQEGKSPYSFLQTVMDRLEDPTVDESFKKELQYTFYQNPVKMTFVQVEPRTVNGVTIFIVKAMNADSKNEDILKRAEWVNNLKQSPLVDMIDSRTFKIDKKVAERVKYLYEKFLNTEKRMILCFVSLKQKNYSEDVLSNPPLPSLYLL